MRLEQLEQLMRVKGISVPAKPPRRARARLETFAALVAQGIAPCDAMRIIHTMEDPTVHA